MKWLNNIKIGARLNFIIGGFVMLTLIGFGAYISVVMSKEMNQTTHERMSEQIDDLVEIIRVEIENNQQQVNISLNLARNYVQTLGAFSINDDETVQFRATNQVTHQSYSVSLPVWMIEGVQIQRDERIVDHIASMGVSTVTIFQKTDQGYLRVSTNVRNEKNERAIGTYIPFDSPVVKMVERGETYFGRAWVVNDWYLSAYEPIYYEGNIVGMLYVGTPEKDLASLKTFFHRKNYFINGYPYVVDSEGLLIIHPTMENTSIANEEFFKTMKMDRSGAVGKMDYIWQGIDKVQYYSYVEDIDSYVVVNYTKKDMRAFLRPIYFGSIVAVLFSTVLVISLVIYIVRSVTNSLAKGVEFAGKLADGDLTATIDIFQRDELGVLAESFRNMAEKIRDIVEGIQMGAASIAGAGNEISSASQQLSQGANEQASGAEEVSSSMEEMAANIHQNTENAQFAQESISRVANSLESLGVAGNESHVAIRTIAEKINIISDIAFQTNILALNAAVEAARAGEHGRGFAVVAAEVRKLAEHSKMAAEEIVGLAESSVVASEKATEIVNEVAPEIIKTVKLAQEIAAASIEQTSGADQVNNAIQQLNQVTQQNAAASEQMATSSEELSSQAEQLRDMVSFFRISEDKAVYQKSAKKESVQTRRTRYTKTQSSKPNKGIQLKGFEGTSHSEVYEKF